MENIPIQRRSDLRYKNNMVGIKCHKSETKDKITGKSINISKNGICAQFMDKLPEKKIIDVELEIPANDSKLNIINFRSRIVWERKLANNKYNYGLCIINQSAETKLAYGSYIDKIKNETTIEDRRLGDTQSNNYNNRRLTKSIFKKCVTNNLVNYLNSNYKIDLYDTAGDISAKINNNNYISFNYCNYLGLNNHPKIKEAMIRSIEHYGTTTSSSRVTSGTMAMHVELEKRLAKFIGGDDCILYDLGFLANLGVISSLVSHHDAIIIDEKSHASIIDGCRLSDGKLHVYKHNDMNSLKKKLSCESGNKIIITDGIFSMDGDMAKLDEIYDLAQKYNSAIMVDDAHALGVIGKNGRGTVEHYGMEGKIDIIMGTLSKTIPMLGGYIIANQKIIDYLKYTSRSYIFTLSLPPYAIAGIMASLDVMQNEPELRQVLWEKVQYIKDKFNKNNIDIGNSNSPIIPIKIGDDDLTLRLGAQLKESGIIVDVVVYPAVKKAESMLRIILNTSHTYEQIDKLCTIVSKFSDKLRPNN